MRTTFKAVAFVSILIAVVLALNMLVAAQDSSQTTGTTRQTDKSKQKDSSRQSDMDKNKEHSHQSATEHQHGSEASTQASAGSGAISLDRSDRKFVMEAAHGGMMEVELGKLAAEKAASDDVKQFGQRMVDDHSKANDELMQLASTKGITLPDSASARSGMAGSSGDSATGSTQLTSATQASGATATGHSSGSMDKDHAAAMKKHHEAMSKLSSLSGSEFDREYMKMMVKDHTKDVAEFEKEASRGKDSDLKAWAAKTLPTLKEHLRMARDVESKVKNSNKNTDASKTSGSSGTRN